MLRDIATDPSLDLDTLARRTDGLSGSDLRELCRNAALIPVRDYMRHKKGDEDLEAEKIKAKRGVRCVARCCFVYVRMLTTITKIAAVAFAAFVSR
jgi:ATP-dependent 26S proteasome regulatory subunit